MTRDEAKKIATVATTADGGCICCVRSLVLELMEALPDQDWKALMAEVDPDNAEEWLSFEEEV